MFRQKAAKKHPPAKKRPVNHTTYRYLYLEVGHTGDTTEARQEVRQSPRQAFLPTSKTGAGLYTVYSNI